MTAVLWSLLALFVLRVAGQLLVAAGFGAWLPPWEEWYSGLLSYPWLLATQIAIVVVFGRICVDFTRRRGFFYEPHRRIGSTLHIAGSMYLFVMIVRYAIRMMLYPHERWTGGSLPIFFHWVLATFLLVVAGHHRQPTPRPRSTMTAFALRALAWAFVAIAISAWIAYQVSPAILAWTLDVRRPEYAVRIDRSVPMTTGDGIVLRADVYRPQRIAKSPTILVRIPFSKTFTNTQFATLVGRFWAEHGYTAVIQGTRGRYESEGRYDPLRHERQDGIDTLKWVARQPWFDGRIGMWGGSAFGHTQWAVADHADPALSALMIQICSTDFHRMFYPGGAFSHRSALHWAGTLTSPPDIPALNDWIAHSQRDDYWRQIDGVDRPETLRAPVHLMAGWFDPFLPGQLADFIRIRKNPRRDVADRTRLVIGPWAHAETVALPGGVTSRNYRLESLAPTIPWFDEHLLGRPSAAAAPRVRIFVMGANIWRDEDAWPPARAVKVTYYLSGNGRAKGSPDEGRLSTAPLTIDQPAEPADSFRYDPLNPVPTRGGAMLGPGSGTLTQNDIEARDDVLLYTTPPLDRDTEVTGPVAVTLHVATSAPKADFTAKLVDVHPDGSAYNVSDGILRREYRPAANPASAEPTAIEIELWPTSMVFRRGHRIRLEVSGSNFPRFDRNPAAATLAIHQGVNAPSRLVLSIVP